MLFRLETREASCQTIGRLGQEPEMALCEKVVIALGSAPSRSTVTMPSVVLFSLRYKAPPSVTSAAVSTQSDPQSSHHSNRKGLFCFTATVAALEDTYSDAAVFETI
jgi:hypothetical protein